MQPEKGYLYEVSQLMYAIIESDNLEVMLKARYTLDTKVYPRMTDYGFNSKREVRDSVHYWRSQQPDPTERLREGRRERWRNGGMTKYEESSISSVRGGGLFKEQSSVGDILKSIWSKYLGEDKNKGNDKDRDKHDDLERD